MSVLGQEMKEVFQWAIDKFLEDWALSMDKSKPVAEEAAAPQDVSVSGDRVAPINDLVYDQAPAVKISEALQMSPEYFWLREHWKIKDRHI